MDLNRWWDNNWKNRVLLGTKSAGDAYTSGIHYIKAELNFYNTPFSGLVRDDLQDVRIVYQTTNNIINVPFYIASGLSPFKVYFQAQDNISSGVDYLYDGNGFYYCYYNANDPSQNNPSEYININFPKAPYSVHPSGYNSTFGTYVDKHMFRLNNLINSQSGFLDQTGHSSGNIVDYADVYNVNSGILDRATYFSYGSYFTIPTDIKHRWDNPSGDWCVDVWVNIWNKNYVDKFFHLFSKEDDNLPDFVIYCENDNGLWRNQAKYPQSTSHQLTQRDDTAVYLPINTWHHVRVAYRTGGDYLKSRIYLYVDGEEKNPSTSLDDTGNVATTAFSDNPILVGRNLGDANYQGEALLEQWRYSTFVYPAMSGADDYSCSPDWVDNQYVLTNFSAQGEQAPEKQLGAIVSTKTEESGSLKVGGYARVLSGENNIKIGGFIFSISQVDNNKIGGLVSSKREAQASVGGFLLASHINLLDNYVESLNRVLIKANSEDIPKQECGFEAGYLLIKNNNKDNFDATIKVQKTKYAQFDSVIKVQKKHLNPYVEITDCHAISGVLYITASGHSYDYNNDPFSSGIDHVSFIWGDNDYTDIISPVESGNIWAASHQFVHSGLYKPIVRVVDRYGKIGSDYCSFDFIPYSGIVHPYISLSGVPRSGYNPLSVDFDVKTSGVINPHTLYWDFGNGIIYFDNTKNQSTQYSIAGNYIPFVRIEDANGIYVIDTLKIGYNI